MKPRDIPIKTTPKEKSIFESGPFVVEMVWDEPDLIIHLFTDTWPEHMKKRIINQMDSHLKEDTYNTAYEPVANSWFIRIFDFCKGRVTPKNSAEAIMKPVVEAIWKETQ